MHTRHIIITLAILVGILSQRSFAAENPNYRMSYKICFGSDCTVGEQQLVRDHFGTLKSENQNEPVLDFIWDVIADAKKDKQTKEQSWANGIMKRHAPEIARRQHSLNSQTDKSNPSVTTHQFKNRELSVSISIPYDKEIFPQIMNAVECLKHQVKDYNHQHSL